MNQTESNKKLNKVIRQLELYTNNLQNKSVQSADALMSQFKTYNLNKIRLLKEEERLLKRIIKVEESIINKLMKIYEILQKNKNANIQNSNNKLMKLYTILQREQNKLNRFRNKHKSVEPSSPSPKVINQFKKFFKK